MSLAADHRIEPASRKDAEAQAIARIAAEASTVWERLAGDFRPAADAPGSARIEARLDRWRDRAGAGEDAAFARRLAWLGQTPDGVRPLLGEVEPSGPLPAWTAMLAEVLADPQAGSALALGGRPFADVLAPFAAAGLRRLAPGAAEVFAPSALADLVSDLVRALSFFAGPVLHLEFSAFRSNALGPGSAPAEGGTDLYRRFAAALRADLPALFGEYAALARLLCITTRMWARNVSALARHLREDADALAERFNGRRALGRPTAVACTLSDRHKGGTTVAILTFETGLRLVYKPRDLSVEIAWFDVLEAVRGEAHERLRRLKILSCGDHGWVEVVEPEPCRDRAAGRRYYRRAGALLAALYALEASDCFHENIIAAGDQPVLIDMETLMHHVLRQAADVAPAEAAAGDVLFDSVFRSGFLPSWETGLNGVTVDISGLGARAGQPTPYVRRRWDGVNTDAMSLRYEPLTIESEAHLPHLDGAPLNVADHAESLVEGFRAAYVRFMRASADAQGPLGRALEALGRCEIRLVFHATRIYALLQKRLFAPRHMRSGVDRSLELDVLGRFYVNSRAKAPFAPLLRAEIAAMEDLDIPYFCVRADSRDLILPDGETIAGAFEQTAIERVRRRIASFSDDDLELQTEFIRSSLSLSSLNLSPPHEHDPDASDPAPHAEVPHEAPDSGDLLAEARRIGQEIGRRAIRSADGSATWISPQLLPGMSHYELRPLRLDLYAGSAGVGLFFAGLQHVCGEGGDLALAALNPLRRFLAEADPARLMREGYSLGAGGGAGSFVYALTRCAGLLAEPALLDDARRAAELITPVLIAADEALDVLSGVAGAALGLLALHAETGDPALVETARLCGERLLQRQAPMGAGAAWRTGRGTALAGMSHGAAGMALALLRLSKAAGDARFAEAARQAIAYEAGLFDAKAGAWPDLRREAADGPSFMNAWCHGGVGIGLARIAGAEVLDAPADLERALHASRTAGLSGKDGLCCGNLGRVALLAAAGPAAEAAARRVAGQALARARRSGGYRLSGRPGAEFFDPSFFQGLAGVGYQLLALAAPGRLPNVLAWD